MQEEIDGLDNLVKAGYVDTFRMYYPEQETYSWWSYRAGARGRNVGWRIDYFLASKDMAAMVGDAHIHTDIMGSDHCPVSVDLKWY